MSRQENCFLKACMSSLPAAKNPFILASWPLCLKEPSLQIKSTNQKTSSTSSSKRPRLSRSSMPNTQDSLDFCLGWQSHQMESILLTISRAESLLWTTERCSGQPLPWVRFGRKDIQMFFQIWEKDSTRFIGSLWYKTQEKYSLTRQLEKSER